MKSKHLLLVSTLLITALRPVLAPAQSSADTQSEQTNSAPAEKKLGNYVISQSVEFGYRFLDVSSSKFNPTDPTNFSMYNTLVNMHAGPRLLEQTFSMQAPGNTGALFDSLFVSSFGFGGDPNDVARVRVSKYKWYQFDALFRRDQNFFDYDLLANPLNPPTSSPALFITFSPHRYETVRRMSDFNLVIAPQSRLRLRLGYSRNTMEGVSFNTIPEASPTENIETLLAQHNNYRTHNYRIGVDLDAAPRTTISYDQFITNSGSSPSWNDAGFSWVLPNGTPADLGISWNTGAGSPCSAPFSPAPPIVNPACNLYLAYLRTNPYRTHTPTEQLSLRSNYFRRVQFTGSLAYSSMNLHGDYSDFFNGFLLDSATRQFTTAGPLAGKRISVNTDFGVTVFLTSRLRINDRFRFYSFRIPSFWNATTQTWAGTSALSPVGPTSDSVDFTIFNRFLAENTKLNQVDVEYDFTKYAGAMLGYRFRTSLYHHMDELNDVTSGDIETGEDIVPVNFHTALAGVWLRPSDRLHANLDVELTTADNFLTRISPRRSLLYRLRAQYKPRPGVTVAATGNVYEARNGITEISFNSHNRNFGVSTTFTRNERMTFDLAYNYNNLRSNAFVCFQGDAALVPLNTFSCTNDNSLFEIYQTYFTRSHFGTATLLLKPVKRLTTNLGYSIVSSHGGATIINPLQPFGSLKSNYHRPLADLEFEFAPGWSAIARWNYYDYNEKTPFFGPTAPRDFHANMETVSLRYSF